MIVMKFGGTSVNSAEKIKIIASLVKKQQKQNPIVVVSALRGVTDMLLELSQKEDVSILAKIHSMHMSVFCGIWGGEVPLEITNYLAICLEKIRSLIKKQKVDLSRTDAIVSYGEILSSHLVSNALQYFHIPSRQVISTSCIITNNNFGSAEVILDKTAIQTRKAIFPLLKNNIVPVLTGFIGATEKGNTTTLGRGGSDYSASIIASSVSASEIQFWKDVDGVYTADPRRVQDAKLLRIMSYEEASALLQSGAKILHPQTLVPVCVANIPIRVLNTLHPESSGTLIRDRGGNYL